MPVRWSVHTDFNQTTTELSIDEKDNIYDFEKTYENDEDQIEALVRTEGKMEDTFMSMRI
ncbi:hypothetical protein HID58_090085, partial [Brassica napus]